jgi:hypothetical protein
MVKRIGSAICGVTALLFGAWGAAAQPGTPQPPVPRETPAQPPGRAFSTSYQPVPQDATFQIRALNNSPANVRIARAVGEALPRRTGAGAALLVTVETEANPVAVRQRDTRWYQPDGHYFQLRIPLGGAAIDEARGGRARSEDGPRSMQFVLHVTVENPNTGARVWDGRAYYTTQADDEDPAFAGMARILAEMMGRTVRTRSFRLQ